MPRRQVISGRVRIPLVSDVVIPFSAVTTFEDFEINTGRPVVFHLPLPAVGDPDSLRLMREARRDSVRAARRGGDRGGSRQSPARGTTPTGGPVDATSCIGRPTIRSRVSRAGAIRSRSPPIPPRRDGSGRRRPSWPDLAEALPDSVTGRRAHGIGYERLTDAFRYDRAQGLSLGLGYRVRVPGVDFTGLYGTVRYGFSDDRVTGRLSLIRDAPDGRLVISGYRDVMNVDPFAPAPGIGNTLNALFVAHDDGDYALLHGASVGYETSLRTGLELNAALRYERQTSVSREASSEINDFLGGSGRFPPNAPVNRGRFAGCGMRLNGTGDFRWQTTTDVLGGEGVTTGRVYGEVRRSVGKRRGLTVGLKSGIATVTDAAAERVPARRRRDGAGARIRGPPRPGLLGGAARHHAVPGPAPPGAVRGRGSGGGSRQPLRRPGACGCGRGPLGFRRAAAIRSQSRGVAGRC